jgi:F420-non-reducing hydrogenase iron-sulfur subunit
MKNKFKPKITLFHCINTFRDGAFLSSNEDKIEVKIVEMACSSMVKDVFLLRAFESGADAVVVMVCPEGACRYIEGNFRAKKRIEWVQKLLDEIGLDGKRLTMYNVSPEDEAGAAQIIQKTVSDLVDLGPNPAA